MIEISDGKFEFKSLALAPTRHSSSLVSLGQCSGTGRPARSLEGFSLLSMSLTVAAACLELCPSVACSGGPHPAAPVREQPGVGGASG